MRRRVDKKEAPSGSFCRLPVPAADTAAAEARTRFWFLVAAGMWLRENIRVVAVDGLSGVRLCVQFRDRHKAAEMCGKMAKRTHIHAHAGV
jgi:hypothetical protein